MSWFRTLTGFDEAEVFNVAAQFDADGEWITSRANGRRMRRGRFEMVSVAELTRRAEASAGAEAARPIRVQVVRGDVRAILEDPASADGVFQVASQFNMLEMVGPDVVPEDGIARYEHDHTQGPACAIACGAATIHRNYLLPLGDGIGQRADRQLDGLLPVATALGERIEMRNGYAWPTADQLRRIGDRLGVLDEAARAELCGLLELGVVWDAEVTTAASGHSVSQVFCSALPVAYASSMRTTTLWEPLAQLVLDALYDGTFAVAAANRLRDVGSSAVWLTSVGGGAFGNAQHWITDAMRRAIDRWADCALDVNIVTFSGPTTDLATLTR